jgi:hypothetical protein
MSAKAGCSKGEEFRRDERSWMYSLKRSGERGCPCSVPLSISMSGERKLAILIQTTDLLYMSDRQSKKCPLIPKHEILWRRSLHTVSKAFHRSTK